MEGSICEIEMNYATDNYVDDRDNRLKDAIDRETAILNTHIDAVSYTHLTLPTNREV